MTREEYLESQRGQPYGTIIANQPTLPTVGSIRGENLRDVVAILAGGLQYRLDTASSGPVRTALLTAFKYLSLPDYAINLSLPENAALLAQAVADGLVTQDESDRFFYLATYDKSLHGITRQDCVAYFGAVISAPASIGYSSQIRVETSSDTPDQSPLRVEVSENGQTWQYAATIHISKAGVYYADIRPSRRQREARYISEYQINAVLSAE